VHPVTHLLTGWVVAHSAPLDRRDRALVTLSGVLPDIDGLGVIAEIATRDSSTPVYWWSEYHHVLCHNIGFGLLVFGAVAFFAVKRRTAAILAIVAFHLHLLGDLVGSRGPDGYQWPIPYLMPFSTKWQLTWDGQWVLNAWPNIFLTVVLLGLTFYLAWRRESSPLEMVSRKADGVLVSTLRKRFGQPRSPHP